MSVPALKRVTVCSAEALSHWLAKNADLTCEVMLVTHAKTSPKHVDRVDLEAVLAERGWQGGKRYTVNSHMVGQVIARNLG